MIRATVIGILILGLSACSVNPTKPIEYRELDHLRIQDPTYIDAIQLPTLPRGQKIEHENVEMIAFSKAELDELVRFKKAAKANTEALNILTEATNALIDERNSLVGAALLEQELVNDKEREIARIDTMRRQDKQDMSIEIWLHKALLALGLIALAL